MLDRAGVVPLSRGLYRVDDEFAYNEERDWKTFWSPIKAGLNRSAKSDLQTPPETSRGATNANSLMVDGVSYEDALWTCLTWWVQLKQVLQDGIQSTNAPFQVD